MQVLVTGGTGFIGRALCQRLLDDGCSLTVFARSPEKVQKIFGDRVRPVSAFSQLEGFQFDAVVNLAGEPIAAARWTEKRKRILEQSRIAFTRELVETLNHLEYKPEVFVSASAVGFYGDQGDTLVNETSHPREDYGHRLCSQWEQAASVIDPSTRLCILRIGPVIGVGGGMLAPMLPFFKLGLGGRLGDGKQWISWVHHADLLSMIVFLLQQKTLQGVFNAVAPTPVTNAQFTSQLAQALRRPAFLHQPAWMVRMMFGEMADLLLGGQRVVPQRLLSAGFTFRFNNLDVALEDVCR